MADRPKDPDDRRYGWLYGADEEDERTRRIPTSRREDDDADRTRVMPTGSGGESRRRDDPYAAPPRRRRYDDPPPPPRPARPAPPPQRRPRTRRPRRWGRTVMLVLLAWVVFLIVVPIWALSTIEEVDAEPRGNRPEDTPGATYLLVGSDSREGLTREQRRELATGNVAGQRTDTILLLHEPRFGGETLLVSIPRDSLVEVPGHGVTKINSAYAFGGPDLLVRTVEMATGLHIDNYVEIGLGGFVDIVDAVGGVQICPEQAMEDPKAGLDVEAGCQEADGETALAYARSRQTYDTGDIGRAQAQREVLSGIADKAVSPWTFVNPVRYFLLNNAVSDALRVGRDTGPIDLARFGWAMYKVGGNNGKTCTVPIADLAVHWDEERAQRLFELIAEDNTDEIGRRLCTRTGLPR